MLKKYLFLSLVIGVNGCANIQASFNDGKIKKNEVISNFTGGTRIAFPEYIEDDQIIAEVSKYLKLNSSFKAPNYRTRTFYRDLRVEHSGKGLNISYIKGEQKDRVNLESVSKVFIPLNIAHSKNETVLNVSEPLNLIEEKVIGSFFIPIEPVASSSELLSDAKSLVNNIKLNAFTKHLEINKEWKSSYSSDAIKSNFERLMSCEGSSDNSLSCNVNDISVQINVFPYRKGALVQGNYVLDYYVYPNAQSELAMAQSKIQTAISKTDEIIND